MKIFGSIKELVSTVFRKDTRQITLEPNQTTTYTADRTIELPPQDASSVLVSSDSSQALTNKTIDGDLNTLQDIGVSSLKTVLADANKVIRRDGSGAVSSGNLVPNNSDLVTTDSAQALTGKTQLQVDNLQLDTNDISSTNSNGNINIIPNGTGKISLQKNTQLEFGSTLTFYDADDSNYIRVDVPAAVGTNRTPQIPDDTGNFTLTSASQALTNKTINADLNTLSNIKNTDIKAGAAIDAAKIADGSVSSTEFQYINSLTSNAQTQLDGKVAKTGDTMTGNLNIDNASSLRLSELDSNGSNYIGLKAPDSVTADLTFTVPGVDGSNGDVIITNGAGVLSFSTPGSVTASRQDFTGLKRFNDGMADVSNIRSSEGAGTTTLTDSDKRHQIFSISAGRDCVLPTTSIKSGEMFIIENTTAFKLTVKSSNGSELTIANSANQYGSMYGKGRVQLIAKQDTPTTPAHWYVSNIFDESSGSLDNNFSGGTYRVRRHNKHVTVTVSNWTWTTLATVSTNPTINAEHRPNAESGTTSRTEVTTKSNGNGTYKLIITSTGVITIDVVSNTNLNSNVAAYSQIDINVDLNISYNL